MSNAKNNPKLRLSLQCTIREELGVEPSYLSIKPDENGAFKHTLTLTTKKKDLQVTDVSFKEHEKQNAGAANWQETLSAHFDHELITPDKPMEDGYYAYQLKIEYPDPVEKTTYGSFLIKTNHPKRLEVSLTGVLLKRDN